MPSELSAVQRHDPARQCNHVLKTMSNWVIPDALMSIRLPA